VLLHSWAFLFHPASREAFRVFLFLNPEKSKMAGRTNVISIASATISISDDLPATYDAAGYGATTVVFTAIGQVETLGNHGVTANVATFTPIDTAIVTKIKGHKDYGVMNMTFGSIPTDAGQVIVKAASESNNHYSVKISYPDGEIHYCDVLVSKYEFQDGSVDDIAKVGVDFQICKAPVIVAAV
jgi:hypothetical protein